MFGKHEKKERPAFNVVTRCLNCGNEQDNYCYKGEEVKDHGIGGHENVRIIFINDEEEIIGCNNCMSMWMRIIKREPL